MNYSETTEYLFGAMPSFQSVGSDAYKPGLERIVSFCELLGNPQQSYRVIHIAGTNGKGSTSHLLASVLQAAGYRVGLFTSPHLVDFRERMRLCGEMISEADVVDFVARHRDDMERLELSFFEMTAAMAFHFFARSKVDIAVIETGLGGRLDATNIVDPILSIITNIALEHTKYLGSTLCAIAGEKCGIIKRGRPVVVGEIEDEYRSVFFDKAVQMESEIYLAQESYCVVDKIDEIDHQSISIERLSNGSILTYRLDLLGDYQKKNLSTLLTAVDVLNTIADINISNEMIEEGVCTVVERTSLRGRWQVLGRDPLMVCDTGHNRHGLEEVVRQIERQSYDKLYCVLGFANDKALDEIIPLFPRSAHYIFTEPKVDRAYRVADVASIADSLGLDFEVEQSVQRAVERACELADVDDMIFIGGSNFVVAELDI